MALMRERDDADMLTVGDTANDAVVGAVDPVVGLAAGVDGTVARLRGYNAVLPA